MASEHSRRCLLLTSLNEYGNPGPCLGMAWADTDNHVYQIESNEIFAWNALELPLCRLLVVQVRDTSGLYVRSQLEKNVKVRGHDTGVPRS